MLQHIRMVTTANKNCIQFLMLRCIYYKSDLLLFPGIVKYRADNLYCGFTANKSIVRSEHNLCSVISILSWEGCTLSLPQVEIFCLAPQNINLTCLTPTRNWKILHAHTLHLPCTHKLLTCTCPTSTDF